MTTNEPSTPPANSQTNVVPLQQKPEPAPHQKVVNFVQDHPVITIAGGLALGAVAAALIPRRNRTFVAKRTSKLADAIAAASAVIAQQAIGQIETAASGVSAQAHSLAGRAEHLGHSLAGRAEKASHSAFGRVEKAGHSSIEKARSLLDSKSTRGFADRVSAKADKLRARLHR